MSYNKEDLIWYRVEKSKTTFDEAKSLGLNGFWGDLQKILLLILCSFIYTFSYSQRSTIELPINSKFGFGPFAPNMIGLQPYSKTDNNPWEKTYLNVTGIPKNWENVKIGDIETNKYQSVYQRLYFRKDYHAMV